jgi:hypothetical protein
MTWVTVYTGSTLAKKFGARSKLGTHGGDLRVESHSTHTLRFSDDDYFDWGVDALKGRRIFIRLYVAGRRSILRLVYAP